MSGQITARGAFLNRNIADLIHETGGSQRQPGLSWESLRTEGRCNPQRGAYDSRGRAGMVGGRRSTPAGYGYGPEFRYGPETRQGLPVVPELKLSRLRTLKEDEYDNGGVNGGVNGGISGEGAEGERGDSRGRQPGSSLRDDNDPYGGRPRKNERLFSLICGSLWIVLPTLLFYFVLDTVYTLERNSLWSGSNALLPDARWPS